MLTPDPARRAGRALDAAQAKFQAGAFEAAQDLLVMAETGPITEPAQVRADLLRARIAFTKNRSSDAAPLLLDVADRLERIDASRSRATYLEAMKAAMFAGRLAGPGAGLRDVARAVGAVARWPESPGAPDLLLAGLAANFNEGYAVAVPFLRRGLGAWAAWASDVSDENEEMRSLWMAGIAAERHWDDEGYQRIAARYVQLARDTGSLSELPLALLHRAHVHLFSGELSAAASLFGELHAVAEVTGARFTPYITWALAAWHGREAEVSAMIEATITDAIQHGQGLSVAVASWAEALLRNGLGQYQQAMIAAHRASCYDGELTPKEWALVELIEAAVRSNMTDTAADALSWLAGQADASGTDWALGIVARCRALLSQGDAAESLYRQALAHLARIGAQPGPAQAGNRLLVQALGGLAVAQQRPGTRLDAPSPVGAGRVGLLGKPIERPGRCVGHLAVRGRLDQLDECPARHPYVPVVAAGVLRRGHRLRVAALAIVEHRFRPADHGYPGALTAKLRIPGGGLD